jgi:signal transduction histidine kinase
MGLAHFLEDIGAPEAHGAVPATMRTLFGKLVVVRLFLAPVLATVLLSFTALDPAPWRVVLVGVLLASVTALFGGEYVRWRRGWTGPHAFPANVVGMMWLQLGAVVLTGGLDSPLIPLLPAIVLQLSLVFGRSIPLALVLGAQITVIWTLVAIEVRGASLAIPALGVGVHGPQWPWVAGSFLTGLLFVATLIGTRARAIVAGVVSRTVDAHDRERQAHADHARELVALSGEIAHELKNPLASIKGLAALIARDGVATDLEGRSAERLAVLRAEVDRMQETLEEFLDFSRPLVPLALTEVDGGQLVAEVVAVCDGVAQARGVRLAADGDGSVRADRRKLRQVLVNLVQNAIEAAPSGSEVRVRAAGAALEVLDRGPGIAEEVRESVFEPGVTTRTRGSGLGLTIARALVQQHGGDLALESRPGGGTRAVVQIAESR